MVYVQDSNSGNNHKFLDDFRGTASMSCKGISRAQVPKSKKLYIHYRQQIYCLTSDNPTGHYTSGFLALGKKGFAFPLTGIVHKGIRTQILTDGDFTWSVLLNYSFPSNRVNIPKQSKV